ncbi:MAG: GAF domain-containing protein [Anaerolineales bacterium]|jgi:signal transduction protein with GAF and PtsI domain
MNDTGLPINSSSVTIKELVQIIEQGGNALYPHFGEQLLQSIVEVAVEIFGAAAASIALVDNSKQQLEFRVAYGEGNQEVVGKSIPLDTGIAGYVITTGQPIAIADVHQDPRFHHSFAESTGYVPKSILATPLFWEDEVIGVMEVLDKVEAPRFSIQDVELLGLFARQASVAIAQSQHYETIGAAILEGLQQWGATQGEDRDIDLDRTVHSSNHVKDRQEFDELAESLRSLAELGEAERRLCVNLIREVTQYLRSRPDLI